MDWVGEFTPEQWAIIGAVATVATGFATAISLMLSMAWRAADQKRVAWITFDATSYWHAPSGTIQYVSVPRGSCELANVGDGTAYAARVVGLGCAVLLKGAAVGSIGGALNPTLELIPAMAPGATVKLEIACEPDDWDRASIAVMWVARPAWIRNRRVELVPLRRVASRPRYLRAEVDPETRAKVRTEAPEPPRPVLPEEFRPERGPAPTRWRALARRRLMRELRRL